ncbi:MAG TPA: hypothetical protein ENJ60_15655 [Aeromonadales bacterium]|nr:hypothetical protein [Aeromonadales bacterium]
MPSVSQETFTQQNTSENKSRRQSSSPKKTPENINNTKSSGIDKLQNEQRSLTDAFKQFSKLSDEILNSYSHLEEKVEALNDELEVVSRQRIEEYEQKKALAQRLQGLLSILPAAVIQLDTAGRVTDFNPVAETLLNTRLKQRSWFEIVSDSFELNQTDGIEARLKDGRHLHVTTCPLPHDKGQLIVLTDVSDMHQLKVRVDRNKRLATIGKSMASLSHQLRTPLATALLYVSHLQNKSIPQAQKQDMARKLQNRLENMNRQIDDMLLFARGGLEMASQFSVLDWFCSIETQISEMLNQQQIEGKFKLQVAPEDMIFINQHALDEALFSLVSNACEAVSHRQSKLIEILLKSTAVNSTNPAVLIQVTDNGEGVCQSVQSELFDPFISSKTRGTGLGLAIVHTVITTAKGQVSWRNLDEGGAEFNLILPLVQELHKNMNALDCSFSASPAVANDDNSPL